MRGLAEACAEREAAHVRFGDVSVELDAIEPEMLRRLVRDCIEHHLPADQLDTLKVAEESERWLLTGLVEGLA